MALFIGRGRKWLQLIPMDSNGIRVRKVPFAEERYLQKLDYPLSRARRHFRSAARLFNSVTGVSKSTRKALKDTKDTQGRAANLGKTAR